MLDVGHKTMLVINRDDRAFAQAFGIRPQGQQLRHERILARCVRDIGAPILDLLVVLPDPNLKIGIAEDIGTIALICCDRVFLLVFLALLRRQNTQKQFVCPSMGFWVIAARARYRAGGTNGTNGAYMALHSG